jgi:hypothetical protein
MPETPFPPTPLNLPHAGTIARRIAHHLDRMFQLKPEVHQGERLELTLKAQQLAEMLDEVRRSEENPPEPMAKVLAHRAAKLARQVVAEIERMGLGDDRLGQAVRNFFECLQLNQEGLELSLRAGENPDSALRPR